MKLGFDRAGTSTARAEDIVKFESGDPEQIRTTLWFCKMAMLCRFVALSISLTQKASPDGYQTAAKRCVLLESQGFSGLLEIICIQGEPHDHR